MKTLSIRGISDDVHSRLRVRAARNARSMEAEARALIEQAVAAGDAKIWIDKLQTKAKRLNTAKSSRRISNAVGRLFAERRREANRDSKS